MKDGPKPLQKLEYKTFTLETADQNACEYCGGLAPDIDIKSVRVKRVARFMALSFKLNSVVLSGMNRGIAQLLQP